MKNRFPLQRSLISVLVSLAVSQAFAYKEIGKLGNTKSWETQEYLNDWGLSNMHASTAYAMGFTGKGVNIGVMDSGVKLSHPAFQSSLVTAVKTQGNYFSDGVRYPDLADVNKRTPYHKGEAFDIDGSFHLGTNDRHGTHVAGSMVAARDGEEMHGVAFDAHLYSANTGGTDKMTYGPYQDYNFFLKGYTALADAGVKAINNSWGSNRKVNSAFEGAWGYGYVYHEDTDTYTLESFSPESMTEKDRFRRHMYLKDLNEAYKAYYQFATKGEKTFLDAAYEVATERQIVQTFTAGNQTDMPEPFTRAMLPYFRPNAEPYWISVTGYGQLDEDERTDESFYHQQYNMAGHAKYWTIAAPAKDIYSARIDSNTGEPVLDDNGNPTINYQTSNGTSMAAPHVTAALGVVMQRYPYLTPAQARDVLLTTARTTDDNGKILEKWTAPEGVPDDRWGWGIMDLGKAMFGPAQFLGTMSVNLEQNDIWSNNISDLALKFRQTEDAQDAGSWETRKAELQSKTNLTANEQAELQIGLDRETARNARIAQNYQGALTKLGNGTLTLAGNNRFSGDIIVEQGRLTGLNQSFGQREDNSSASIRVQNGAQLEVLANVVVVKPTETGFKTNVRQSQNRTVTATIEQGATFVLNNGVANLQLSFAPNSQIQAAEFDDATLQSLRDNPTQTLVYRGKGKFDGVEQAQIVSPYAFYQAQKNLINGEKSAVNSGENLFAAPSASQDTLELTVSKVAMVSQARNENEAAIANAIERDNGTLAQSLQFASLAQAYTTFDSLGYDADLAAQQHNLINHLMLNQQLAQPAIRAKLSSGSQIWSSSSVNRLSSSQIGNGKLHSRTVNQLVGADTAIGEHGKAGVFFGATTTKHKFNVNSKDRELHLGLYGEYQFTPFAVKTGVIHSWGKQEHQSVLANGKTRQRSENLFVEASHSGWIGDAFALETYADAGYQHWYYQGFQHDEIYIQKKHRDIFSASFGLRPTLPFKLGSLNFSLQGDLAYHRLFGDNQAHAVMQIGSQFAHLYSQKLRNLLSSGVALQANFTPSFSFKIGYQGMYGNDVHANSLNAQLRFAF